MKKLLCMLTIICSLTMSSVAFAMPFKFEMDATFNTQTIMIYNMNANIDSFVYLGSTYVLASHAVDVLNEHAVAIDIPRQVFTKHLVVTSQAIDVTVNGKHVVIKSLVCNDKAYVSLSRLTTLAGLYYKYDGRTDTIYVNETDVPIPNAPPPLASMDAGSHFHNAVDIGYGKEFTYQPEGFTNAVTIELAVTEITEVDLTVKDVIRGDIATSILESIQKDIADQKLLLVKVRADFLDCDIADNNKTLHIDHSGFFLGSPAGNMIGAMQETMPPMPAFDLNLKKGEYGEGYMLASISKDAATPYLMHDDYVGYGSTCTITYDDGCIETVNPDTITFTWYKLYK